MDDRLKLGIVQEGAASVVLRVADTNVPDIQAQVCGLVANLSEDLESQATLVEDAMVPPLVTLGRLENDEI